MVDVSVIGAGISGPAAALSLVKAGHNVRLYESRYPQDLHSYGVIGIVPDNVTSLRNMGADLSRVELDNSYTEWTPIGVHTQRWGGSYVMWTDIHNVILDAAIDNGAVPQFGKEYIPDKGIVIQATGVGYAAWRGLIPHYAYTVYRGLSRFDTEFAWLSYNDPEKRFSYKMAHSPIGASWEIYVHRANPVMRSVQSMDLPTEREFLPAEFQTVINGTREMAIAPISDWDVSRVTNDNIHFATGDANGAMRPHTGMGANLGIQEAMALPKLIESPDEAKVRELYSNRVFQHDRGIRMGTALLGN